MSSAGLSIVSRIAHRHPIFCITLERKLDMVGRFVLGLGEKAGSVSQQSNQTMGQTPGLSHESSEKALPCESGGASDSLLKKGAGTLEAPNDSVKSEAPESSRPLFQQAAKDSVSPVTPPPTLTSQHTQSFADLLSELGISLAVTTYQAGKLVLLRAEDGVVNTHFRGFSKPMGLAEINGRLAIGTSVEIWEFHNAPAVARRVDGLGTKVEGQTEPSTLNRQPSAKHDVCYLPRGSHTTGDIQIHEMTWVEDELWFINTRFSCLCTRDVRYSFVPRWRPPFITAIAPEDRCHLNGFCVSSLRPQPHSPSFFVTALGQTDTQGGWRANKRDGGLLMETGSNEVLLRGLSMPHSPRVYADQLWVLESGTGSIGRVDLPAGRYEPIASLPGFTRGIDFHGRYAFIGLSQVRESAVFSGIPIAERPVSERSCGVWVVDIVTGQTVAWLKFDDGVQEIFAVKVLANTRFPDLINDDRKLIADSFILSDESLDSVPDDLRFVEARK